MERKLISANPLQDGASRRILRQSEQDLLKKYQETYGAPVQEAKVYQQPKLVQQQRPPSHQAPPV
jgi:altronate dehydratase